MGAADCVTLVPLKHKDFKVSQVSVDAPTVSSINDLIFSQLRIQAISELLSMPILMIGIAACFES